MACPPSPAQSGRISRPSSRAPVAIAISSWSTSARTIDVAASVSARASMLPVILPRTVSALAETAPSIEPSSPTTTSGARTVPRTLPWISTEPCETTSPSISRSAATSEWRAPSGAGSGQDGDLLRRGMLGVVPESKGLQHWSRVRGLGQLGKAKRPAGSGRGQAVIFSNPGHTGDVAMSTDYRIGPRPRGTHSNCKKPICLEWVAICLYVPEACSGLTS